jgi:ABC-type uncharacterized transport system auxiliary subunit
MSKFGILSIGILFILLLGCSAGELVSPNYYILEYYQHSEKEELRQETPLDLSVYVYDTKIPKTYNKNQIVIRHFGPRITYSNYDLWGVKLSKTIPELISKRLNSYNIFKRTQREILTTRADYEIITNLNNIELYKSETVQQARLNIDFVFRKSEQADILVEHSVNIEKALLFDDMDTFIQTINDILLNETDNFIRKIILYSVLDTEAVLPSIITREEAEPLIFEISEEEEISGGKGLLLLPAITRTDNEPHYKIIDKYGYEQSGQMGTAIPLLEGIYSIKYGSGKANQLMSQDNIKVVPRYKTIIEPDWGCLIVDIMDEKRNFAKVRYEVFDLENGESFGSEFPAEEEVGEQEKVWVLKSGIYKVTVNNEPFNTYRDFTTVFVEKGKVQKLTIVMKTDEEDNPTNMAGAGVLEESFLEASLANLKFSSAIHGNVNINSNNEVDKDNPETTITFNTQLENYLIYDKDPLHYTMKNLIEVGISKTTDTDFQLAADEFDLKNTLIYYFIKDVGFYSRFDVNSHFFPEKLYSSDKFYYTKIDKDNIAADSVFADEIEIKSSLFPLVLKEGVGINYRILNYPRANLSLRAGFGIRQDINNDFYDLSSMATIDNIEHRTYTERESESTTGTEVSLVGSFQLPFNLTYSTNADFLFPFSKDDDYSMEWENVINLKLFKYISLDYKLKLENKIPETGDEYIVEKHSLFLRVTYFLR